MRAGKAAVAGAFGCVVIALWPSAWAQETSRSTDKESKAPLAIRLPKPDAQLSRPSISLAEGTRAPSFYEPHRSWLGRDFVEDQKQIWTSPGRLRLSDANWLVPLGGLTAGLIVTDRDYSAHLSQGPNTLRRYRTVSNAGAAALLGAAGGLTLWGLKSHDDHRRETGMLAGEAVLNSLVVVSALKYTTRRERPLVGDGRGQFLRGGNSFPSEHAAAAWAAASVIAHEYPGPLTKLLAYGTAAAVSFSRVHSREHFASDVLLGSLIGQLVAQQVYRRRHNPELGGGPWEYIGERFRHGDASSSRNLGSPYVPLDSWVYPALDRLIALGYIHSAFLGMRPWTRAECARIISEAGEQIQDGQQESSEAARIYSALTREFSQDVELLGGGTNRRLHVESVYSRFTAISGQPLSEGTNYDFGQTLINDFGRPYEEGFNNVTGFSGWASSGPFVLYVRGEYQHAPSAPALPDSARQTISQAAFGLIPSPPATPLAQTDQFRLLDAYVGMNFENWQLTFGKQSLWWGPGEGGPMMFSNNAEPIVMFRISRVSPFRLPSFLGALGPMRVEFFVGQLDGHHFVNAPSSVTGTWSDSLNPQPFINGQKLSFRPTPNLEIGFSRTTIFAGSGVPFTPRTFLKSIFNTEGVAAPGSSMDAGDRRTGLDFTYRIPRLRNWLTFYANGFADDQIIFAPNEYASRAVWHAGLYLSRLPKLPKLDLRTEGVYTDIPAGGNLSHGFYYFNLRYLEGYTNKGKLLGSWIGRQGQGVQAWSNYWFTPRDRVQLNFRHHKVSQQFIPGGGTLTDAGARGDFWLRTDLSISGILQYEKWNFPVLAPRAQTNWTTSVGVSFWPRSWSK